MEDFNQPSPERTKLLEHLHEKIGVVAPHFWAACQICDLSALEKLSHNEVGVIQAISGQTSQMVRHWGSSPGYQSRPPTPKTPTPQRSTVSNSSPSPSSLPSPSKRQKTLDSPTALPRDAYIKKRAEERDNFCCVLTGMDLTEIAYIYPYHSIKQKEDKGGLRHKFWNHLRMFWSEKKVTAWEAKLFPQGIYEKGSEEVYNLISLAPHVHAIWGRGLFALKPISESDDKKTLTVQFLWQTRQKSPFPVISLTTQPHSTEGLQQTIGAHGGHIRLFDKNDKKIQSGDYFKLQTDDPIQKPLPSFELLELQWFLHRIQGMAGAIDVDWEEVYWDLDSDSDNAEEVPGLCDDNDVEELSLVSSEPLSSPLSHVNNKLLMHSKHQEAEGARAGEGGGAGEEGRDFLI